MASTEFKTLWQAVLDELGPHHVMTTGPAAVGPDPGRWLISPQARSDGHAPQFVGHWFQVNTGLASAGRIVHEEPSLGALAVDLPVATAQSSGIEFETMYPLPITTEQGCTGVAQLIQQACREVWFPDVIDFTTARGAYTYDFSDQADWLDSEARVVALYDPPVAEGYPQQPAPWRYGGINFVGGAPVLRLKRAYLASGGTAQLEVIRPAYSLINGAESTVGPAAFNDVVYADRAEIIAVTKLRAYRYLATAKHITDDERQRYAAMVAPQEAWVRANLRHYLPRDEAPQQDAGKAA